MFEIERRFLVKPGVPLNDALKVEKITQGFMSTDPARTIRVRIVESLDGPDTVSAYITVKGKTDPRICCEGFTRREIETEIDFSAASSMLSHFCGASNSLGTSLIIEKIRFTIPHGEDLWEVDVFKTDNAGLIIAELEIASEDQIVDLPEWIGEEITHDHRYANSQLSLFPYSQFKD
jgi:adenylate cyclase